MAPFANSGTAYGFFRGRFAVETSLGNYDDSELIDYVNVSPLVGAVISSAKATLHECNTVYSIEDLYDILEIVNVDAHNKRVLSKKKPDADSY